jgi:hypothetical protein
MLASHISNVIAYIIRQHTNHIDAEVELLEVETDVLKRRLRQTKYDALTLLHPNNRIVQWSFFRIEIQKMVRTAKTIQSTMDTSMNEIEQQQERLNDLSSQVSLPVPHIYTCQ